MKGRSVVYGKVFTFCHPLRGDLINYLIPFYTSCVYVLPVAFENEFIRSPPASSFPFCFLASLSIYRFQFTKINTRVKEKHAKILHTIKYLLNVEWACTFQGTIVPFNLNWKFEYIFHLFHICHISLSILLLAEQNLYLTFCRLKRLHLPVPHFRLWVVMVVKRKLMKNLHHLRLKKQSELFQIYYHGKLQCVWRCGRGGSERENCVLDEMKNYFNFLTLWTLISLSTSTLTLSFIICVRRARHVIFFLYSSSAPLE